MHIVDETGEPQKEIVAPSFSRVPEDAPGELTRLVPDIQGKTVPAEISITNEEKLTIENIQLKTQLLQHQLDVVFKALVTKYNIDVQMWSYDVISGKFTKRNEIKN